MDAVVQIVHLLKYEAAAMLQPVPPVGEKFTDTMKHPSCDTNTTNVGAADGTSATQGRNIRCSTKNARAAPT